MHILQLEHFVGTNQSVIQIPAFRLGEQMEKDADKRCEDYVITALLHPLMPNLEVKEAENKGKSTDKGYNLLIQRDIRVGIRLTLPIHNYGLNLASSLLSLSNDTASRYQTIVFIQRSTPLQSCH